jgi:hypothetical protein
MDSISIGWENVDFAAQVVNNVRELGHPITYRDRLGKRRSPFRGYQTTISSLIENKRVFIGCDPYGKNLPALMMSFHCSHFSNMTELMEWLGLIVEGDFQTTTEGFIRRLDCCVDLALPYELIREAADQPRVTTISEWTSNSRTTYFGKHPRQTCFYEKMINIESVDNIPARKLKSNAAGRIQAVRVEVSTTGNRVPIKTLGEIEKLHSINPFKHLTFKQIDEAIVELLSMRKRYPIEAYQLRAKQVGAAMAKREIGQGGNFSRNVGKYLKPFELDLNACWKRRTSRFLQGFQGFAVEGVAND